MAITGAVGAFLRRNDPYPDWTFVHDYTGLGPNNPGRPVYKNNGVIYNRPDYDPNFSFTRSGADLIYFNPVENIWKAVEANKTGIDSSGFQIHESTTNKCTNYNAAPQALIAPSTAAVFNAAITGMQAGGDANARFSVVDDTAALRAAGFGALIDAGKLNGRVYKIDNSLGSTSAQLLCYSTATTLVPVAVSAFVAGGSGSVGMHLGTGPNGFFAPSSTYQRRVALGTPTNTGAVPRVTADAGQVVYFILNQFEEKAYATNPVIVSGASATRGSTSATILNLASTLTPPFTLVVVANMSAIDGQTRRIMTTSVSGSSNDRAYLSRGLGNDAGAFETLAGVTQNSSQTGKTGPRLLKVAGRYRASQFSGFVDGVALPAQTQNCPLGLNILNLGTNEQNGSPLNSPLLFAGIAPDMTDAQLQAITASNNLYMDFQ